MATFLQLVNDLERESGTIYKAQRLSTVIDAPGRQEKMVAWVREAWHIIQTSRSDWPWLVKEFSASLVAGQARYTALELGIANFAGWPRKSGDFTIYDPVVGQQEEIELRAMRYDAWRARWDRGVHDASRPTEYAVDNDRKLCVGAKPDKIYTVRGSYRRTSQILTVDSDVPICPEDFHNIIVWRAMMLMGGHDEALVVVAQAQANYARLFRDLVDDMGEEVSL